MSYASELDIDVRELVMQFTHDDAYNLLSLDPESEDAAEERGELFDRLDTKGWMAPTITRAIAAALERGDILRAQELISSSTEVVDRSADSGRGGFLTETTTTTPEASTA